MDKHVEILKFDDIILSEEDEKIYNMHFCALYEEMNRKSIDMKSQNFKTYNKSGEILGEIHSVIAAQFIGIPLLLSDDFCAKEIAARRLNFWGYNLDVKKSFDALCEMIKNTRTDI